MAFTQTWIIEKKAFPPEPLEFVPVHGTLQQPWSLAFFCPVTGEVWARRVVVLRDGTTAPWMIFSNTRKGYDHSPFAYWPSGALFIREEEYKTLPLPVLLHQFNIYYEWASTHGVLDNLD